MKDTFKLNTSQIKKIISISSQCYEYILYSVVFVLTSRYLLYLLIKWQCHLSIQIKCYLLGFQLPVYDDYNSLLLAKNQSVIAYIHQKNRIIHY